MKNKFIKIILIVLSTIFIITIGLVVCGGIMMIGNSRMPVVVVTKELKELEKTIGKETKSNDHTYFNTIPKYAIEKCNARLSLNVYVNNDSIIRSKKILDDYIISINKRVKERLVDKKCIDSLIIDVSYYYSKEKKERLNPKRYRYSFPIK